MGRGEGARNPKERLTKKREREGYKRELDEIHSQRRAARADSVSGGSFGGSFAGSFAASLSPISGRKDLNGLNNSERTG